MKNPIAIISLILVLIALILCGFFGYIRELRKREAIMHLDSIRYEKFNNQIVKIDSVNRILLHKDSIQDLKINSFKKKVSATKHKYEENSNNMPILPDFQ